MPRVHCLNCRTSADTAKSIVADTSQQLVKVSFPLRHSRGVSASQIAIRPPGNFAWLALVPSRGPELRESG